MSLLTVTPAQIGEGGAHLAKGGAAGDPDLYTLLEQHRVALAQNQSAPGVNLTDAAATIQIGEGAWRRLPAATLTAARVLTLGTVGAVAGDRLTVTRLDATANTYAIANGGGGGGTLVTFPVSKIGYAVAQFDGTNWLLREVGSL